MLQPPLRVRHLYVSSGHNFFGRHGKPAAEHVTLEVSEIHCLPGQGIEGDRFFDYKTGYKGQITFFAQEVYARLCAELNVSDKSPAAFRRNVVCEGVDLNSLTGGQEFEVQGVRFRGREECRPCYWMDQSFGTGAETALKGWGGLRAEILTEGILRVER